MHASRRVLWRSAMRREALSLGVALSVASSAISARLHAQSDVGGHGPIVVSTNLGLPPAYDGSDAVDLEVNTDTEIGAYLMQSAPAGGSAGWAELCMLPCRLRVDPKRQ